LEKQRKLHANQRAQGNKAEQVAAIHEEQRAQERAQREAIQANLNFSFGEHDRCREIPGEQHPFSQPHGWEKTRYAGVFLYWIPLICHWSWLHRVMGHFGKAWRIFAVFLLMGGRNIRSMEQLKPVRQLEAGRVLGLGRLPSKTILWEWFYEAARQGLARTLLDDYFRHQLRSGLVSLWLWFTDGHLLPYTGKEKVHYRYNTQRRMPVAGRTSQVTCDATGRIVDFRIEEGEGEMKQRILGVVEQWLPELSARPIAVFDREGYDSDFFSALVNAKQPFVTWDKNVDTTRLETIAEERFNRGRGRKSKLSSKHKQALYDRVVAGPEANGFDCGVWNSVMIAEMILLKFNVKYTLRYLSTLLKKLGLSYQKARFICDRQDEEEYAQARKQWVEQTWPEILQEAKTKGAVILFGDEVSFAMWGSLGRTWAPRGKQPEVKQDHGYSKRIKDVWCNRI
jgi:transposase